MKELIEKLKNYNRWRRGDEAVPMPHPQEIGEMIDQAIKAIEDYLKTQGGRKMKNEDLKTLLQFTFAVIIAIFVCAAIFIAVVNVI